MAEQLGYQHWKLFTSLTEEEVGSELSSSFEAVFKPWPLRIYGFDGLQLTLNMEPRGCVLNLAELTHWVTHDDDGAKP